MGNSTIRIKNVFILKKKKKKKGLLLKHIIFNCKNMACHAQSTLHKINLDQTSLIRPHPLNRKQPYGDILIYSYWTQANVHFAILVLITVEFIYQSTK